ncbi:DUF1624 domain-containing protein [Candidatus Peregrinibacteria bacterium]|nr:DUF1624 domain-containing protein [Candidatus Peregrinibacteria bacterium]
MLRDPPQAPARLRLPELDALRGLAVLLMVIYHTAFDLQYFYGWGIDIFAGGWWILARTSAILFLLIAGICATISWERTSWRKILRRFAVLASAATLVSFTTWLIAPQDFVKFGILHLFAFATLLLPLFAPLKYWNGLLGILAILIPTIPTVLTIHTIPTLPTPIAIILGFPPPSFSSLDYFPLLPWFGVMLIGLSLGHALYIGNHSWRRSRERETRNEQLAAPLALLGRHSLLIYLRHQPILLALLFLLLKPPSSY